MEYFINAIIKTAIVIGGMYVIINGIFEIVRYFKNKVAVKKTEVVYYNAEAEEEHVFIHTETSQLFIMDETSTFLFNMPFNSDPNWEYLGEL